MSGHRAAAIQGHSGGAEEVRVPDDGTQRAALGVSGGRLHAVGTALHKICFVTPEGAQRSAAGSELREREADDVTKWNLM